MIFKRKLDERAHVKGYEARLVTEEYVQNYGMDYDKTFSPIVLIDVILL